MLVEGWGSTLHSNYRLFIPYKIIYWFPCVALGLRRETNLWVKWGKFYVCKFVKYSPNLLCVNVMICCKKEIPLPKKQLPKLRGGGPLMISHKSQLISWLILAPRPPMHFLHITFPGTIIKISHCTKFHSSSCLISWLPKSDLCETTEGIPPLCEDNILREREGL